MIENLGNKLKTARVNRNLSRKQVADLVGVTTSMVGMYESGEGLPLSTGTLLLRNGKVFMIRAVHRTGPPTHKKAVGACRRLKYI